MTFIVEDMTQEMVNKILDDLNCNLKKRQRFINLKVLEDRRRKVAINREIDSYLFKNTTYSRELGNSYDFYFNGKFYLICFSDTANIDKIIRVDEGFEIGIQIPNDFKEALTNAFFVYGVYGHGPYNHLSNKPSSDLAVNPIISNEVLK